MRVVNEDDSQYETQSIYSDGQVMRVNKMGIKVNVENMDKQSAMSSDSDFAADFKKNMLGSEYSQGSIRKIANSQYWSSNPCEDSNS